MWVYWGMTNEGRGGIQPEWSDCRRQVAGSYAPAGSDLREILEQMPRNHDPLDLARSLSDLADLRVAHHALDRKVPGVAVTTVELHRGDGRAHGQLGAEELGHRRFLRERVLVL